jgi:hypothetical protein
MLQNKENTDLDKLLEEVLKTEPDYGLSENFAFITADKVARKFAWQQYIAEFLIYLAVIVGVIAVVSGFAFFWFGANWKEWLSFIRANATLVAGVNILVLFVLFADRVLLRYYMFKSNNQIQVD